MRGGILPPAILCTALGLALASAKRRSKVMGLVILATIATMTAFVPVPSSLTDAAFLGCWISTVINSSSVHVQQKYRENFVLVLALNTGIWAGAVISLSAPKVDLAAALPWTLCMFPAGWMLRRNQSIALKVVSSWLIAVAFLAATLQFLSVTPGYRPDHLD
jgi:hypothetical protein